MTSRPPELALGRKVLVPPKLVAGFFPTSDISIWSSTGTVVGLSPA